MSRTDTGLGRPGSSVTLSSSSIFLVVEECGGDDSGDVVGLFTSVTSYR